MVSEHESWLTPSLIPPKRLNRKNNLFKDQSESTFEIHVQYIHENFKHVNM